MITSTMRSFSVDLNRALVLPFVNGQGRGFVVVGATTRAAGPVELAAVSDLSDEVHRLRVGISDARHRDIDRAYRAVARAATSDLALDRVFDLTLAAARNLTAGDVAYLAMPVDDDQFAFTQTLGITTSDFMDLRVGHGEGLGGAVREGGRPVRSLNYAEDERLRRAMRDETRNEGIVSAMAVPVRDGDRIEAILYVASRTPRAYNEDDEGVLADFASATLLGLGRGGLDASRQEFIRQQERTRLARTLHDDLVRRLTRIGFNAEILERNADENSSHASAISASVIECMSLVRNELRDLIEVGSEQHTSLSGIADRIFAVPSLGGFTRSARFGPTGSASDGELRIPDDVAEAMVRIGQEAVFNAEHHSGGTWCSVTFRPDTDRCFLEIANDGKIIATPTIRDGHHGLNLIRQEARRVGGEVQFVQRAAGGLTVTTEFPMIDGWMD
nr:GAF domain-containing protein [Rhodococcus sp. 06-418-1B]